MNTVEIDKKLLSYTIDDYDNMIQDSDSIYKVNRDYLNTIDMINGESSKLAYYITYLITRDSNLSPNINTPRNGLEFRNIGFNDYLGIYHAHLEDEFVLIWYVELDEYNDYYLKAKCLKHPSSYNDILKEIMRSNKGYDVLRKDYFKNYINKTYLKESRYILSFYEFIRSRILNK